MQRRTDVDESIQRPLAKRQHHPRKLRRHLRRQLLFGDRVIQTIYGVSVLFTKPMAVPTLCRLKGAMQRTEIISILDKEPCPQRLFPARVRALGQLLEQPLMEYVAAEIVIPIRSVFGSGWEEQFERDFKTYGLGEAIVYLHTYPKTLHLEGLTTIACQLFHRIARLYTQHRRTLEASDDPRIQAQLELVRELHGDSRHPVGQWRAAPRPVPEPIACPMRPVVVSGYRRMLPMQHDLQEVLKMTFGTGESPVHSLSEELIEHLQATYMFQSFPGVQTFPFEIAEFLDSFQVDIFSSMGQFILSAMIEALEREMFGDYDRYLSCSDCEKEYKPEISLSAMNVVLGSGGWLCGACRKAGKDPVRTEAL